jgi:hypothetical protein
MSTHFHLFLYQRTEDAISTFMRQLIMKYRWFYGKKYFWNGPLFDSTFKAIHVRTHQYCQKLREYILANPVKVITYIYNSPIINVFKDTEYKYMIQVFNNYILQNVYLKINTILTQQQNYIVPPPPPLFNRYYDTTYSPGIETQKLERNITQA